MKKYILILLAIVSFSLVGCSEFLDRPSRTQMNDGNYWTSENNVRLFVNGFYENYFVGYNATWGTAYAPLRGYAFSDDFTSTDKQRDFEKNVPTTRQSTKEEVAWLSEYASSNWCFSWVRKANLLLERLNTMKEKKILTDEQYNHWSGVARFFRAYEYSRLVTTFGDVPYYDAVIKDSEFDLMYKDRDSRDVVMEKVAEDLEYALANVRVNDGSVYLNKYGVAGFATRFMVFEGTWQKYHKGNNTLAKKFLELAVKAGDVINSNSAYSFSSDFRSIFGSQNLAGNKEVIMFRHYDAAQGITHHVASYSNTQEGQAGGPNLALAKQFICKDGKTYSESNLANADKLDLQNMFKTRDPRFEATFYEKPTISSATLLYACKFIDREGVKKENHQNPNYISNTNTNDAPVIRLGEVVLNWIEAKAELATLGGPAVTQNDIDRSINAIRNRPLDKVAEAKGVQKTAPLQLGALPNDPDKDSDVSSLIWEIRRERRMELIFEHSRLLDIKRWKKIEYMDPDKNPDMMRGLWINIDEEYPEVCVASRIGKLQVQKADGTIVTYDGNNQADLVGYYIPQGIKPRDSFNYDRAYVSPVGEQQINQYTDKGKTLSQTPAWK